MSSGTGWPHARSHWWSEHICFARSLYCENVLRKPNSKSEWGWEESLGENEYMYMCGQVPLLSTVTLLISYCVVLVALSCLTLCNSTDYSPSGSSVHGILQARILEWVAMPSSRRSFQPRDRTQVSTLQADSLLFEPPGIPISYTLIWNKKFRKQIEWGNHEGRARTQVPLKAACILQQERGRFPVCWQLGAALACSQWEATTTSDSHFPPMNFCSKQPFPTFSCPL